MSFIFLYHLIKNNHLLVGMVSSDTGVSQLGVFLVCLVPVVSSGNEKNTHHGSNTVDHRYYISGGRTGGGLV
jgi:hypothetical protein